ncbi:putative transcription factor interactor and regulator CCHC(Zn) family [Rosa chinensis]|uniref:Putative transcription factor interactor and regulator CCHC(Zn) family n=1 Tax=Rosa chinensis TaxID=74649 RepID=A0A2P6RGN1_ROSCH|nr:putative transcription factor interactor and regulator CCHC(Zn) family [Rosa chinensis]
MNNALCGGPWILAGQTLVVQKWRPDFDPMNEHIGKMALWVRILGLPVKYFKDYAVAKIGKVLGDVVKVDKLTIGQARGKFARVCIEIDLNKPLRPYVEVESIAYQVVYEGISLICFECGCFGHSKDNCPSIKTSENATDLQQANSNETDQSPTGDKDIDGNEMGMTIMQHDSDSTSPNVVIKEDMGPWMLMSYRNKKELVRLVEPRKMFLLGPDLLFSRMKVS